MRPQKCWSALWSLRKAWSNLSRAVAHCNETSGYLCWHSPDALQAALVWGAPFVDFPKLGKLVLNFMIPWCQGTVNLWASRRSLLLGCVFLWPPLCWQEMGDGTDWLQVNPARGDQGWKLIFIYNSFPVWLMSWLCGANAGMKEGANLYTGNLHRHQLKSDADLQCS